MLIEVLDEVLGEAEVDPLTIHNEIAGYLTEYKWATPA